MYVYEILRYVQFAQYWRDHNVCLTLYRHTPMPPLYCVPIPVVMGSYPKTSAPVCGRDCIVGMYNI